MVLVRARMTNVCVNMLMIFVHLGMELVHFFKVCVNILKLFVHMVIEYVHIVLVCVNVVI